jgi:thymidylate synthase
MLIHGDQKEITDFKFEDFELINYDPHPSIKAPIAV